MLAIDINDIDPDEKAAIIRSNVDMACDNCDTVFESLAEAHLHYFSVHDMKGYVKCCDIRIREDQVLKEHIAYHYNPDAYQWVCLLIKNHGCTQFFIKNNERLFKFTGASYAAWPLKWSRNFVSIWRIMRLI